MERIGTGMEWPEVTEMLQAWARNPSAQAHPVATNHAIECASRMRSRCFSPPTYVDSTPDGGVKFEWRGPGIVFETRQYLVDIVTELETAP